MILIISKRGTKDVEFLSFIICGMALGMLVTVGFSILSFNNYSLFTSFIETRPTVDTVLPVMISLES